MYLNKMSNFLIAAACFVMLPLGLIFLAYHYVDSPVAFYIKNLLDKTITPQVSSWFISYKEILSIGVMFDVICFYGAQGIFILCLLYPKSIHNIKIMHGAMYSSLSIIIAYVLKDSLKMFFGRCCVKSAANAKLINIILSSQDTLNFHFFYGQAGGALFPSGHMTVTSALAASLCLLLPRFKGLWVAVAVLMGASLIVTNNHFVSDVLAGAFLGVGISYLTYKLFNIVAPPKHSLSL